MIWFGEQKWQIGLKSTGVDYLLISKARASRAPHNCRLWLEGRSAQLAHGEENRTDLLAQCQPCMLIKSAFDPVFCFGLVFFSPCVPLLILFYLIDVHWVA